MKLQALETKVRKAVIAGLEDVARENDGKYITIDMGGWQSEIYLSEQSAEECYSYTGHHRRPGSDIDHSNVDEFLDKIVRDEWERSFEDMLAEEEKGNQEIEEQLNYQWNHFACQSFRRW